jgi:hypothetical protein
MEEYKGEHEAPGIEETPLWDLTINGYPEDIYSADGARLYGEKSQSDYEVLSLIKRLRNKPNAKVTVYRAIPKSIFPISPDEKLRNIEKEMRYILKYGKLPKNPMYKGIGRYEYFDVLHNEKEELLKMIDDKSSKVKIKKPTINSGDWVTIYRPYAVFHGKDNLNNQYKILKKTVRAKEVFTDCNSIYEWGYVDLSNIEKEMKKSVKR